VKYAALLLLLLAASVRAEPGAKTTPFELNGQPGIWFPKAKAVQLLNDVKKVPTLEALTKKLTQRVALELESRKLLEKSQANLVQQKELLVKTNAQLGRELTLERKRRTAWWRSPVLWLAVGVLSATAATVGVVAAVK
jgi:hypothetical protein